MLTMACCCMTQKKNIINNSQGSTMPERYIVPAKLDPVKRNSNGEAIRNELDLEMIVKD